MTIRNKMIRAMVVFPCLLFASCNREKTHDCQHLTNALEQSVFTPLQMQEDFVRHAEHCEYCRKFLEDNGLSKKISHSF